MAELSGTGGSDAFGSSRVPPLDTKGTGKPLPSNDEVTAILKGLKLDKKFFTSKLNPDILRSLEPDEEGAGKKMTAAGRTSDFDIYLNEAMMPVLAQALDALCRQIVRMNKQGSLLDAKVRSRFNPITWLAQQLLRRHPRAASTPRRLHIYRNFKDWADYERGRRELLRSKKQIEEVFNGFLIRGVVGRNTLPSVLKSTDDTFRLRGLLKDNKDIQQEVVGHLENQETSTQPSVRGKRRSMLGGEGISFDQFWYKLANSVLKHDIVSYSALQAGQELIRLEIEENVRREEAAKREEERRARDAEEHKRLLSIYEILYPKMQDDEVLAEIKKTRKCLSGDFLKPSDQRYQQEVAPNGPHVNLLEELLKLLGFEVSRQGSKDASGISTVELGEQIFRQKVKHETKSLPEEEEKDKDKGKAKDKLRGSVKRSADGDKDQAKEEEAPKPAAPRASISRAGSKQAVKDGRWWDPVLKGAWAVLQEIHGVAKPDGNVEAKVLQEIMTPPDNFINLKKKVEMEFERRAEGGGEGEDDFLDILKNVGGAKPSMEELCQQLKMSRGRLDFFHDLFESFLPKTKDGKMGVCLYPECPAVINKKTMQALIQEVQPGVSEDEFDARFRRIDNDGSGLIEFDEFARWVHEEEVQITGSMAQKMSFEELSANLNIPLDLIQYIYACFCNELGDDEVDEYPETCFAMTLDRSFSLVGLVTPGVSKKEFEADFKSLDIANKGLVTFDEFLELVDLNQLPKELKEKYKLAAHAA